MNKMQEINAKLWKSVTERKQKYLISFGVEDGQTHPGPKQTLEPTLAKNRIGNSGSQNACPRRMYFRLLTCSGVSTPLKCVINIFDKFLEVFKDFIFLTPAMISVAIAGSIKLKIK